MKKYSIIALFALVAVAASLYAGLAVPGEFSPDVYEMSLELNGGKYTVVRTVDKDVLTLAVKDADEKVIWKSDEIGMQARDFEYAKKLSSLVVVDVDGDKVPEIIAGTTLDGANSAVYVFRYNSENKVFEPMKAGYEGSSMVRDFMVSDIEAAAGASIIFETNDSVKVIGKIFTDDGPVPGIYTFKLDSGKFMCTHQEKAVANK